MNMFKPKCKLCKAKLKGDIAEIRLKTADGLIEMKICSTCADLFDAKADHAQRKKDD